jgi:hypothetical protein
MTEENGVRFLLDEKNQDANFIYKPPNYSEPKAQNATLGVKFAQGVHFLDPWGFMLIGKSRGERIWFRLLHPIPYAKRGWNRLYRRVRSLFIKDRMVPCIPRQWVSKEELLKQYPEVNNGANQKQENTAQQN